MDLISKRKEFRIKYEELCEKVFGIREKVFEKSEQLKFFPFGEKNRIKIMVCGGYKTGKSSFLNSVISKIMGCKRKNRPQIKYFCPTDTLSCTAVIWIVRYGKIPRITLFYHEREEGNLKSPTPEFKKLLSIDLSKKRVKKLNAIHQELRINHAESTKIKATFNKLTSIKNEEMVDIGYYNGKKIAKVVVEIDNENLKPYEFVDTPGLKERGELTELVKNMYGKCDMIWYLTHFCVGSGFDKDDIEEIGYIAKQLTVRFNTDGFTRMRIIANKIDEFMRYKSEELDNMEENDESDGEMDEEDGFVKDAERLKKQKLTTASALKNKCESKVDVDMIADEFIFPYCSVQRQGYKYSDFYVECREKLIFLLQSFQEQVLFQNIALLNLNEVKKSIDGVYFIKNSAEEIKKCMEMNSNCSNELLKLKTDILKKMKKQISEKVLTKSLKEDIWKIIKLKKMDSMLRKKYNFYIREGEARNIIATEISSVIVRRLGDLRIEHMGKIYEMVKKKIPENEPSCSSPTKKIVHTSHKIGMGFGMVVSAIPAGVAGVAAWFGCFAVGAGIGSLVGPVGAACGVVVGEVVGMGALVAVGKGISCSGKGLGSAIGSASSEIFGVSYDNEKWKKSAFDDAWKQIFRSISVEKFVKSCEEEVCDVVKIFTDAMEQNIKDLSVIQGKSFHPDFVLEVSNALEEVSNEMDDLKNKVLGKKEWIINGEDEKKT